MKSVEIFGILNVTPDSFSDGGLYVDPNKAVAHAEELFRQGANYVDVGAESTRPGADKLTHEQEWSRLVLVLSSLLYAYPDHISLDTYHPETVRRAARNLGSFIINDVTAFNNEAMIEAAVEGDLSCIASHLPEAVDQDIQEAHRIKPVDSVDQVLDELQSKRAKMINAGINPGKIILDPGIGFGKTPELNWQLLEFGLLVPGIDVMVGYSRKRFLGDKRMEVETNLAAAVTAINADTRYLRVHDVAEHRQLIDTMAA